MPTSENEPNNELQFEVEQENGEELNLPVNQREVLTRPADPQVRALHDKYKRGKLILQPDFQRQYVWDRKKASRLGTSAEDMVRLRFDLARQWIEGTLREHRIEPRCFSRELKKNLFDANPTCALCGQSISEVDDAAVDHIEQYWRGGKTIPENARLTHRYCNSARPRNS